MDAFAGWWNELPTLNQGFFAAAVFFGVLFAWQLVMALVGLGGGESAVESHVEHAWEHEATGDAEQTVHAFQVLSVRSVLAFCTLFTWAGALYMSRGLAVSVSLLYALAWGLAALVLTSWLIHAMRKLAETGTMRIAACVGASGTVYLDIPAGGVGEVRVMCGGVMTHLKARAAGGGEIKAGAAARILRVVGPNTVEVDVERSVAGGTR